MTSVFETSHFRKILKKLSDKHVAVVDGEIEKVLINPTIGVKKTGDLYYVWVHKFRLANIEVLLVYQWLEESKAVCLLHLSALEEKKN